MGNLINNRMATSSNTPKVNSEVKQYESVHTFTFLDFFPEEDNNGLYLNNVYFPEEVVMMILSYVDPKEILKASQVCKKWFNIVRSDSFWASIYNRKYHKKSKKLPWYVYYSLLTTNFFNTNLIKNGNGQEQFKHWKIIFNYGDEFRIEDPPNGSDPLPADIPDFNGKTSCFATSYYECNKLQEILVENRLMQLVLSRYKPHIYVSEWVAGRFDCGCVYNLWCKLYGDRVEKDSKPPKEVEENSMDTFSDFENEDEEDLEAPLHVQSVAFREEQWMGKKWSKVELVVKDYPPGVQRIVFQHEGRDTQFWKGHYGSKMAGGVLKIVFDSIEPLK